jgi:pimeloyl-ACP methyl ester carboxylesterase
MRVQEYGQQKPNVILLLHGGGLSWWNYRAAEQKLAAQYHVALPVLDGHADSNAPFTTIEEHSARLISYIDDYFDGQVLAIGGLSLGGQIAVEMLSQRKDVCQYALIESALVKPIKLTSALITPTFGASFSLIRQKWFAKLQADFLGIPKELFDDYFRDTCKIGKADMIAFLKANCAYGCKTGLGETVAKVKIVAGAKEQKNILDSAKLLRDTIPGSQLEILPGLRHGDLSMNHPERYVRILKEWEA